MNLFIGSYRHQMYMPAAVLLTWIMAFTGSGCSGDGKPGQMQLVDSLTLRGIPSGSGMAVAFNDSVYIVGDDATSLYVAGQATFRHREIRLASIPRGMYREAKTVKHDFESAAVINVEGSQFLLAFGSGSQTPGRDSLLLVNLRDPDRQVSFSLSQFYDSLRTQTSTSKAMWNIEGSAVNGHNLLLVNRGNNVLIRLDADAFLHFILHPGNPMPVAKEWQTIDLPMLQGKPARLSGLSTINDSLLLFCASVEDTPDWTSDGPVLGSFIGVYSLTAKAVRYCFLLKDDKGEALKEKLESVEWLHQPDERQGDILAIADNDDGSTKLFRVRFPVSFRLSH